MENSVRNPVVAGSFYPADSVILRKTVADFIEAAEPDKLEGTVTTIISPHAGYIFSGQVASYGFKLIAGNTYETVVVISPSHTEYFNYSSIYNGKIYRTPLGDIPIDNQLAEKIASFDNNIRIDTKGHIPSPSGRGEHALEVQLPFLQVALGNFKLVPIVMGDQSSENIKSLGNALAISLKGKSFLIVASTDLSHFHDSVTANRLDNIFIDHLKKLDPEGLAKAIASGATEACGGGPVLAAMKASLKLGANSCRIFKHANSGDITGDTNNVVGYVSAAFIKNKHQKEDPSLSDENSGKVEKKGSNSNNKDQSLSEKDKIFLLKFARKVIETKFTGHDVDIAIPPSPILKKMRGAFVTLKKNGQLRGCIGYIEAVKPLIETIADMAEAAAFNDYRFPPVKTEEVSQLSIEISVLSPIREIENPSTIEVGRDGLIMSRGGKRGLLLPQVPIEWGW
ncbi:AmmeMemoRadiSam system protein B, partial [bacterium]|nr:AmmeMemoRadiSam system protein B [bacterium]